MHHTRHWPRGIVVVPIALAISLSWGILRPPPTSEIAVIEVVDGDTIVVSFGGRTNEIVRLLGVDTPETVDPSRPEQCFGTEASRFLQSLLPPGAHIRFERDNEARDRYGRLLGYVFRAEDELFVNEALIGNGYADLSIYSPNTAYQAEFTAALTSARTRSVGLWSACGGADVPLDPPALTAPS